MSEHRFTQRFDSRYDNDRTAWSKLNQLQQRQHLSFNRIVIEALNAYEDQYLRLHPEDRHLLVEELTEAVSEKLQQMLPAYLAGYTAGAAAPAVQEVPSAASVPMPTVLAPIDDDAPDFSYSTMDYGFIGG